MRKLKDSFAELPNSKEYHVLFDQVVNCASLGKQEAVELTAEYHEIDKDGSNGLSRDEVKAHFRKKQGGDIDDDVLESWFDPSCDTNGDGELSLMEYLSVMATGYVS